jgi:ERCC4-type nuclease
VAGSSVVRVVVDVFERSSGIGELLRCAGVEVEVASLPCGDYDLGQGVLVERKTVADLHLSLQRGRLWTQIGRLRDAARLPHLVVEGSALDIAATAPSAIRGVCLAVLGQGVALLRTQDAADSALWLRLLASRAAGVRIQRDRPAYAQRLKPQAELVREAVLAAVPGISAHCARALLEHYGSIARLIEAGPDSWRSVRGIGPARAEALARALL